MSNYLFSGYEFTSDLNASFKLQNLLQSQTGEEQQMSIKLLNRQSEGFAIGAKTPYGQTPKFVLDQIIGGSTQNLITLDSNTSQLGLNFNVDLGNTYKVQNSIAPTDGGDLANKLYVDNLARLRSLDLTTNTNAFSITKNTDVENPIFNIDLSNVLQNFSDLSSDGLVHKTGTDSFTTFAPSVTDGQVLTTNAGTFAWQDLSRVTSIGLTTNTNALAITGSPVTDTGDINIDISTSLQNFSNLNTAGLLEQTGVDTYNVLPLGSNNQVLVINNDSLSWTNFNRVTSIGITSNTDALSITGTPITDNGDINVDVSSSLQNLSNISGTGFIKQTGADTFTNFAAPVTDNQVIVSSGGDFGWTDFNRVTSIGLTSASTGLSITNTPITDNGNINVDLSARLENISNLSSLGIVVKDDIDTFSTTPIGSMGQFLGVNGSGQLEWQNTGTVTSIAMTTSSGLSVTGTPITNNGTLGLTLDAPLQNFNNLATDGLVIKSGTSYSTSTIPAVSGQILESTGSGVQWITPQGGGNVNGTGSSTLNALAVWNNTAGTSIKNSSVTVSGTSIYAYGFVGNYISSSSGTVSLYNQLYVTPSEARCQSTFKVNTIQSNGNSFIRSWSPIAINGSLGESHSYGYLNSSGNTGTGSGYNNYSLFCNDRVKASEFNATSSRTIKNILARDKEIEDEAISLFRQIAYTKYQYKDTVKEGEGEYFGVIAEELREVAPHFVNDNKMFIPNIYSDGEVEKVSQYYTIYVHNELPEITGNKVKIHTENKVLELDIMLTVKGKIMVTSEEELPKKVFVYGTYEDSPTVAKNKMFELGCVVLKNALHRIEQLEEKVNRLC
jgi:hypothetical protein